MLAVIGLIACFITGLVAACGGSGAHRDRAAALAKTGDLDAAIAELKYAVAANPDDVKSHVALARLQLRAQRPGAALRHFEVGERNHGLDRDDRAALAALYLARARQRLEAGDGDALEDLESASRVDHTVVIATELRVEVLRLAALRSLARSEAAGADRAREHLRALGELDADDWRIALLEPESAEVDALGRAAAWVYRGGARRAGLVFLESYRRRGGRLYGRELLAARTWWGGRDSLPDILEVAELAEQGAIPCLAAATPDDFRCSAALHALAEDSPQDAEAVRVRAADKFWRSAHPDAAAAWVIITLRAWLAGSVESWLGELTRRVDVDALADELDDVPPFARPTLLRALGRLTMARNALPAAAADAAAGSAAARAVVVAEVLALGIDPRAEDELRRQETSDPAAWLVAARGGVARRGAGSRSRRVLVARG